ncbi:amidohydrolase family protein [Neptunomonas phycophila]|uniref:amidohydrolase family protein n=1 Tax=Neptunomonas phycophila TaxID=1572645 RepID=UPI000948A034|nr:amidohydrolase family protein [Neptunomonas phycophila]
MKRIITGIPPLTQLPAGSVDTHMHVYAPQHLGHPNGPKPPLDFANLDDYLSLQRWLGLEKVVIVQPNAYQTDNRCMLEALDQLGNNARGIVVVTPKTSEEELLSMHKRGARGARIMELPGGAVGLKHLTEVNAKIRALGWHCIVQFDGRDMIEHTPLLNQINDTYIIDHGGKFLGPTTPNSSTFKALLKLIDKGNCYVKIGAVYESSYTGGEEYTDVAALSKALIKHAPERILWASNWPHVSQTIEDAPNDAQLLDTVCSWIPNDEVIEKIFVTNPHQLYDFT